LSIASDRHQRPGVLRDYLESVSSPSAPSADRICRGCGPWALSWPCIYEFLRVITHPRVFHPPVPLEVALTDLKAITDSPSLLLLSETERYVELMTSIAKEAGVTGNLIHDAHIAALCIEHGVTELISARPRFSCDLSRSRL
jgi:uncharacterized protein